jgi:hypothetical protein
MNLVYQVMLVTPLVVAPLVLGGVYLGLYLGNLWGYSGSILAIAFSTVGFIVAMVILSRLIVAMVAKSKPRGGAS